MTSQHLLSHMHNRLAHAWSITALNLQYVTSRSNLECASLNTVCISNSFPNISSKKFQTKRFQKLQFNVVAEIDVKFPMAQAGLSRQTQATHTGMIAFASMFNYSNYWTVIRLFIIPATSFNHNQTWSSQSKLNLGFISCNKSSSLVLGHRFQLERSTTDSKKALPQTSSDPSFSQFTRAELNPACRK